MNKLFLTGIMFFGMALGAHSSPVVGELAPDFSLLDQDEKEHKLSDYQGQKVVVYFYPKDDTPGCTKEACSIRDDYSLYEEAKIKVFGVSYDSAESHRKFREKYDIPFTLLTDADKKVSKAYDASGIFVASRKTFLIDESGVLVKIYENVDVSAHGQQILSDFKKLAESKNP